MITYVKDGLVKYTVGPGFLNLVVNKMTNQSLDFSLKKTTPKNSQFVPVNKASVGKHCQKEEITSIQM